MTLQGRTLTKAKTAEVVKRKIMPPWVKNLKSSQGRAYFLTNSSTPCTSQTVSGVMNYRILYWSQ